MQSSFDAAASPPTLDLRNHSRQRLLWCRLLFWMALIFGTSCTVVLPREFFTWIREHIIRDDAAFGRFRVFWGVSWFAIVKSWHALEFALLFKFGFAVLGHLTGTHRRRTLFVTLLLTIAFAASDEWHQTFVEGRGGTVSDVLIDSAGALAAAAVALKKLTTCRQIPPERGTTNITPESR